MGQLLELPVSPLDFRKGQLPESIQAELFNIEGSHDRTEDYGLSNSSLGKILRPGKKSDEAAGKAVAGAGRIEHVFQGKCRSAKHRFFAEHQNAVLAAL